MPKPTEGHIRGADSYGPHWLGGQPTKPTTYRCIECNYLNTPARSCEHLPWWKVPKPMQLANERIRANIGFCDGSPGHRGPAGRRR